MLGKTILSLDIFKKKKSYETNEIYLYDKEILYLHPTILTKPKKYNKIKQKFKQILKYRILCVLVFPRWFAFNEVFNGLKQLTLFTLYCL